MKDYDRHSATVWRIIGSKMHGCSHADMEDVHSESMLALWRAGFPEMAQSERAFMSTVVKCRIANFWYRQSRDPGVSAFREIDWVGTSADPIDGRGQWMDFVSALDSTTPRTREVVLARMAGQGPSEIGAEMDLSPNVVSQILARFRRAAA